jgi:hypothetical protein
MYWNVQPNSSTGLPQQKTVPASRCIVLRPGTAGEVLKWKVSVMRSDTVQESAGTSFTVKWAGPQRSTGQVTLTLKSVGGGKKRGSQSALNTLHVSVGVGFGAGIGVAVILRAGIGVGIGVTIGDSSALGAIARDGLTTAIASTTTAAALIAKVVPCSSRAFISLCESLCGE